MTVVADASSGALARLAEAELSRPVPDAARLIVDEIRRRHGAAVRCILFYGSHRREGDIGGLLDLYVLFDSHRAFHRRPVPALFNRLLPPNVLFVSVAGPKGPIRAKVAVMSRRAFARRMRSETLDTTIWTRFCQPASLAYAADEEVRRWAVMTVAEGMRTAAGWAAALAPGTTSSEDRWRSLFSATYRLELRPERGDRSVQVYRANRGWFDAISDAVVMAAEVPDRHASWRARRLAGKPLNLARLVKAAFTFDGGADYISGKLGRHTGVVIRPTAWQHRHPLLGAPGLLLAHRRARRRMFDQN